MAAYVCLTHRDGSTRRRANPLDRATHARRLVGRPLAGLGDLFHRFVELAPRTRPRHEAHAGGIEAAAVLQLVARVEAEEIGRALRVIGAPHRLRLVDHIGEGEAVPLREQLHVVEGIRGIVSGIVGHDGDRADAERAQRVRFRNDAANARFHVRAVVADEDDQRAGLAAHVGERPGLAVDALEREVTRLPTEVADAGFRPSHQSPPRAMRLLDF
jgi:hypothetical protein